MKDLESNIACFPSVPWSHNWERQHELITRLAGETEGRVEVIPPLGMINHSLKGIFTKLRQRQASKSAPVISNPVASNMHFAKPLFIPRHFNPAIDKINQLLLRKSLSFEPEQAIGYFTYVNSASLRLMKNFKLSILDLAQRRQVSNELSIELKQTEREAVRTADLVISDNRACIHDYAQDRKDIHYIPQGVNIDDFSDEQVNLRLLQKAESWKAVIGFIGTDMAIDYDLLLKAVKAMPEYLFVMLGQLERKEAQELFNLPNLWHAGRVTHNELSSYLNGFDVGLIPYALNQFTQGVFPTKAFEYLAAGVPVVSTSLPELQAYQNEGLVLAGSQHAFVDSVAKLINNKPAKNSLKAIATKESWDSRYETLLALIKDHLKNRST